MEKHPSTAYNYIFINFTILIYTTRIKTSEPLGITLMYVIKGAMDERLIFKKVQWMIPNYLVTIKSPSPFFIALEKSLHNTSGFIFNAIFLVCTDL